MNVEFIEAFGEVDPPSGMNVNNGNSFSVNCSGDIISMDMSGNLCYSNIRSKERSFSKLPVANISNNEIQQFSNIEFDLDGRLILLWSRHRLGYIELPLECVKHGALDFGSSDRSCIYTELTEALHGDESIDAVGSIPIAKASFHPTCQHLVVVLNERESIRMIDLRSMDTQIVALSTDVRFSSFCFGPKGIAWLQFSIFLLSALGDVYILCPVIPRGSIVSQATVDELWNWLDAISEASGVISDSEAANKTYTAVVRAYLQETFGVRDNDNTPPIDGVSHNGYVRAGEVAYWNRADDAEWIDSPIAAGSAGASAAMQSDLSGDRMLLSTYLSSLRGPIAVESIAGVIAEADGGKQQLCSRNNIVRCGSSANDICVPGFRPGPAGSSAGTTDDAAPVLAVSFSNGSVQLLMIDAQDWSPSFVGPSWRSIDLSRPQLQYPLPSLLVAETVTLPRDNLLRANVGIGSAGTPHAGADAGAEVMQFWKVAPDPGALIELCSQAGDSL